MVLKEDYPIIANMEGVSNHDKGLVSEYQSRFEASANRASKIESAGCLPDLGRKEVRDVIQVSREINILAGNGLYRWKSEIYPGVSAIHTRMSAVEAVGNLAGGWGNHKLQIEMGELLSNESARQEIFVLFSSMPGIFSTDGSTHTAFDIAMERMGIAMSKVVNANKRNDQVKIDVYCVGNSMSASGVATEKMIRDLEKDPYGIQAKLDAEVLYKLLKDNPKSKITLLGQSWGGAEAVQALKTLEVMLDAKNEKNLLYEPEVEKTVTRSRVRVLADDPTPLWAGKNLFKGAVKTALDNKMNRLSDYAAKIWFPDEFKKWLKNKGLYIKDSLDQKRLKKRGRRALFRALGEGPLPDSSGSIYPVESRVYLRQAVGDETLNTEVRGGTGTEHHVDLYPRSGGHALDRFKQTTIRRIGVVTRNIRGALQG